MTLFTALHHLGLLGALTLFLIALPLCLSTLMDCWDGVSEYQDPHTRKVILFAGVTFFVFVLGCFSGE